VSEAARPQKSKRRLKTMDQAVQPGQFQPEARRRAVVILEVLAGVRTGPQAAASLGVSLQRYLEIERRAIRGLLIACSGPLRGETDSSQVRVHQLEATVARLESQVRRHQALLRAAQRGIGLAPPPPQASRPGGAAKRKSRRPTVRALRVVEMLQESDRTMAVATPAAAGDSATTPSASSTSSSSSSPPPQPAAPTATGPVAPAG
jgi:hypothetical protein